MQGAKRTRSGSRSLKSIPLSFKAYEEYSFKEFTVNPDYSTEIVLDKAKNYIAVHGNRNRDELHARSYPPHASTAENISRVDVSYSVAVLDECAGCNVLKTQIATQDARIANQDARISTQDAHIANQDAHIATQDAHIADMRASQAARDGYILVRDLIQDSLNALMFLVKRNLNNEIRMKCTLNAMQCAYDFSVTNKIVRYRLGNLDLTEEQLKDIQTAMETTFQTLGFTMNDFRTLNKLGNDIASTVHSHNLDIASLRSKLTELPLDDNTREELEEMLQIASRVSQL